MPEISLPSDVKAILLSATEFDFIEGVYGFGKEICDDLAVTAKQLCDKYGIRYIVKYEDYTNQYSYGSRAVYSDGTKGEWE